MWGSEFLPEAELRQGQVDRRSSSYVSWTQQSLNRVSGAGLAVDGRYGPRTRAAVLAFQVRHGLAPDGVVGPRTEAALIAAGASPPPGPQVSPAPAPVPGRAVLIRQEDQPRDATLYINYGLGGESPATPMTGIFIPAGFRAEPQVSLVIYLQGHRGEQAARMSIDTYWNSARYRQRGLREGLNQSGKNAVLVAPTLGPKSQAGRLVQPGGFDAYVDDIMTVLRSHGPYRTAGAVPTPGAIILAGHSGGGLPMRLIALSAGRYVARISECWAFDSLYNSPDPASWARWARANPARRLYVHYTADGGTAGYSRALAAYGIPNITVELSSAPHDWVPTTHWVPRLRQAGGLRDR